ncbi:amidohydrolase family protein [Candidatus Kapabacteria bacterium]|nr:amidohydrolase family protein [Candidatus Kapabacteria bacterium]
MKIDVHTHIMPEKMPNWTKKFGYGDFIHLEHHHPGCGKMMKGDTFFREIESNCWDSESRLVDCEKHNVDIQVLSTIPVLFNYWAKPEHCLEISRFLNDDIAQRVEEHPDRFIGLGTIPMQDSELAIKELERIKNELKLPGIEIGTHVNGKNLDNPDLFPILKACEDLDLAIFIHPWDMLGGDRLNKYWMKWLVSMPAETTTAIMSLIFGGVLDKLPNLRICFAHGGGSYIGTLSRIKHGFDVRPDLIAVNTKKSPYDYFGMLYFDSLTHDKTMLKYLIELAGFDRVCLGTDYPFPLGELEPGKLIDSIESFTTEQKDLLNYKTALNWLKIDSK